MGDTLLSLYKNALIEIRKHKLRLQIPDETKLIILKKDLYKRYKDSLTHEIFLKYLYSYISDKIVYEIDDYDLITINIGINIIKGITKRLIYFNSTKILKYDDLIDDITTLCLAILRNDNIVILFEYSDNEGRMLLSKDYKKFRKNSIIYNDFPLYNLKIIKD